MGTQTEVQECLRAFLPSNLASFRPQASCPIKVVGYKLGAHKPKLRFDSLERDNSFHHVSSPSCIPRHSKQKDATGQKTDQRKVGITQMSPALLLRGQARSITLPKTEAFRSSLSLIVSSQRPLRSRQCVGALNQLLSLFLGRSCLPRAYTRETGQG